MDIDSLNDEITDSISDAITNGTMAAHTKRYRQGNHEREVVTVVDLAEAALKLAQAQAISGVDPTFHFKQAVRE